MALIPCPDCSETVSSRARACPHCGTILTPDVPLPRRSLTATAVPQLSGPIEGLTTGQIVGQLTAIRSQLEATTDLATRHRLLERRTQLRARARRLQDGGASEAGGSRATAATGAATGNTLPPGLRTARRPGIIPFFMTIHIIALIGIAIVAVAVYRADAGEVGALGGWVGVALILAGWLSALIYFAPSWSAGIRNAPNRGAVFVVNLFFGWTFVGWIVAFAMALSHEAPYRWRKRAGAWQLVPRYGRPVATVNDPVGRGMAP